MSALACRLQRLLRKRNMSSRAGIQRVVVAVLLATHRARTYHNRRRHVGPALVIRTSAPPRHGKHHNNSTVTPSGAEPNAHNTSKARAHSTPRHHGGDGDCSLTALAAVFHRRRRLRRFGDPARPRRQTSLPACAAGCLLCALAFRPAGDGGGNGKAAHAQWTRVNRNLMQFAFVFLCACFLACDAFVRWSGAAAWLCGKGATSVSSHCPLCGLLPSLRDLRFIFPSCS